MKGDYSRFTFDPRENVRAVMFQQGRPLDDASLNEAAAVTLHRIEVEAVDVVGAQGAPLHGGGFRLAKAAAQLTAAEAADPRNQGAPAAPFLITAGRLYVDGVQVENHHICGPDTQPLPLPANLPALQGTGRRLVYIKVVIDHKTGVESPRLLDPAFGDADTTARTCVTWQVRLLATGANDVCDTVLADWDKLTLPLAGRVKLSVDPGVGSTDPCKLSAAGGYTRPENLHYRAEVDGGDALSAVDGDQRFGRANLLVKISRNNAMEVARIAAVNGKDLHIDVASRDGMPVFRVGEYLEILSDTDLSDSGTQVGWTQIAAVDGDVVTVSDATGAQPGQRIRSWSVDRVKLTAANGFAVSLDGLKFEFQNDGYRRGTYFLAPARYASSDIMIPPNERLSVAPAGPRVHYLRLGFIDLVNGVVQAAMLDCRNVFEPLTELLSFHYAGGDGQTVSPAGIAAGAFAPAATRLAAGVRIGRKPVRGARVRFDFPLAPAAGGQLTRAGAGPGAGQGTTVIAETDGDGIASVTWALNLTDDVQRVRAVLLDSGDPTNTQTLPLPIEYSASLNWAKLVAYVPGACAGLNGLTDVQAALDKLCKDLAKAAIPALFVKDVLRLAGNVSLPNNATLAPKDLIEGIRVVLSEELGTATDGLEPIMQVAIDLPYPSEPGGREAWGKRGLIPAAPPLSPLIGVIRLELLGTIKVDGPSLVWLPEKATSRFLQTAPQHRFGLRPLPPEPNIDPPEVPIRGYLTVRGDCVWSKAADPRRYLNGEILAKQTQNNPFDMTGQDLDPQRAADYRIWFNLRV